MNRLDAAKHAADHRRNFGTEPDRRCRMVRSTDCWCSTRPEKVST